jgi:hypothetical protein
MATANDTSRKDGVKTTVLTIPRTVITPGNKVYFGGKARVDDRESKAIKADLRRARKVKEYVEETDEQLASGGGSQAQDDPGEGNTPSDELREDGPTPTEWVNNGNDLKDYPPAGFVAKNDAGELVEPQE